MRLLFTGRGGNGSWQVRGDQLGEACGAVVKTNATAEDFEECDLAVVVKRVPSRLLEDLRDSGKPWAFDIVDAFPQPASSAWSAKQSIDWVRALLDKLDPTAVIWPNERMRHDCCDGRPGMVLRHHYRPNAQPNPIREKIEKVGYEGRSLYLNSWRHHLVRECVRRGYAFVENPTGLSELDVVVAFRGGEWDSYASRHWKSNVKLANAHGTGTPFVGQPADAYVESSTGCEYWVTDPAGIRVALDWLESQSAREQIHDRFLRAAYSVTDAAFDLKLFLSTLV